jgi:NAD(P)-dependent dehydrogenase (short-subunit alcohol dehydrogenase family)
MGGRPLLGKVAVVTGGARGLGRAYCLRLASLGADVAVVDISLDAWREWDEPIGAESVPAELEQLGVRALGLEVDVTDRSAVYAMAEEVERRLGGVDILVANAGGQLLPVEGSAASLVSEEHWRTILDVNLNSTVWCCEAVAPRMVSRGGGSIVTVSSQAGLRGNRDGMMSAYCTAKAGVVQYTRLLAAELGPVGVRVNCIAPGLIVTSRAAGQFGRHLPENQRALSADIPLRRLGSVEDAAGVVEFLCTPLSAYVTGQVIAVCGGMVLSPC